MYTRLSKVTLIWSIAVYTFLVAFNNLTDYESNLTIVKHVLVMDTTFHGNKGMWRAIESPTIHHVIYGVIILTEIVIAFLCGLGGLRLYQNIKRPAAFNETKSLAILGLTLGFLLWFTGFMTIGGEWFLMWQSETANGQQAAFRLVTIMGIVLAYLVQIDKENHS